MNADAEVLTAPPAPVGNSRLQWRILWGFVLGLVADISSIQWALAGSALVLIAGCALVALRNPVVIATE